MSHFFIAVPLAREAKLSLFDKTSQLQSEFPFHRWIHPEDYHITLVFLGQVSVGVLNQIKLALQTAIVNRRDFHLALDKWGTFGEPKRPRILWAGVQGEMERLRELHKQIQEALNPLGFTPERREYNPHITVARKSQQPDFELQAMQNRFPLPVIQWQVEEIILYQTDMNKIPHYKNVAQFKLNG